MLLPEVMQQDVQRIIVLRDLEEIKAEKTVKHVKWLHRCTYGDRSYCRHIL